MILFRTYYFTHLLLAVLVAFPTVSNSAQQKNRPEVLAFVDEMVEKHEFDQQALLKLFKQAKVNKTVLKAIQSPSEAKPWYQYRKIFLNESRIRKGVAYWNENEATLLLATKQYGIPPEIIVAIIGVETLYGGYTGSFSVLDSLFTLTFEYPKRAPFFRTQLEHFLVLCREEALDPTVPKGSYAGAMGLPQFMPSSYRSYARDFDNDNVRDIWHNNADTIASVANYFSKHGWRTDEPVAYPVTVNGNRHESALEKGLKPNRTIQQLRTLDIQIPQLVNPEEKARLISFEELAGPNFWIGLQNFYVITRYNHSAHYAMAVLQLGKKILARKK